MKSIKQIVEDYRLKRELAQSAIDRLNGKSMFIPYKSSPVLLNENIPVLIPKIGKEIRYRTEVKK